MVEEIIRNTTVDFIDDDDIEFLLEFADEVRIRRKVETEDDIEHVKYVVDVVFREGV